VAPLLELLLLLPLLLLCLEHQTLPPHSHKQKTPA
jgi:hypothetical protein